LVPAPVNGANPTTNVVNQGFQPNIRQGGLQNGPNVGANPGNPGQRFNVGGLNPNQLREAYNKLKIERRNDYESQAALDKAVEIEKEEDDV
jgi:hypothetical protein